MIGYPNKKKTYAHAGIAHDNRGMNFEEDINTSNEFYRDQNIALIYKKPTPVQIVKVDYPSRNKAKIVEAYFKVPSTTDYNGIYRGRAIDFEAKQVANVASFPLKILHPHQVEHLRRVQYHNGIGFILIRFTHYDEVYLVDAAHVIRQYEDPAVKSLTYAWVKQVGHRVKEGLAPRLQYLSVIDKLYFKGDATDGEKKETANR